MPSTAPKRKRYFGFKAREHLADKLERAAALKRQSWSEFIREAVDRLADDTLQGREGPADRSGE